MIDMSDFHKGVSHPLDRDELDIDGAGDVGGIPRVENQLTKLVVAQAVVLIVVGRQKENLIVPPDFDHLLEADLERIPFVHDPAAAKERRVVIIDDHAFPDAGQIGGEVKSGVAGRSEASDPSRGGIERIERHFQADCQFRWAASGGGLEKVES